MFLFICPLPPVVYSTNSFTTSSAQSIGHKAVMQSVLAYHAWKKYSDPLLKEKFQLT